MARSIWATNFIAVGAALSAFFFALVWQFPSGLTEAGYFLRLLLFSCATYVGLSVLSVVWQVLSFETTDDYHEES
jgi:GPH family glycoside/pentoside/hexuronide:cation symporter